jgi:hypothetical protein
MPFPNWPLPNTLHQINSSKHLSKTDQFETPFAHWPVSNPFHTMTSLKLLSQTGQFQTPFVHWPAANTFLKQTSFKHLLIVGQFQTPFAHWPVSNSFLRQTSFKHLSHTDQFQTPFPDRPVSNTFPKQTSFKHLSHTDQFQTPLRKWAVSRTFHKLTNVICVYKVYNFISWFSYFVCFKISATDRLYHGTICRLAYRQNKITWIEAFDLKAAKMWFQMFRLENVPTCAGGASTFSGSQRPSDRTTRQLHHSIYSGPEGDANGLARRIKETLFQLRHPA